jgi:hypothetical protein
MRSVRELLHEQYSGRGRSAPDIARELGLPKNTIIGRIGRYWISKPAGSQLSAMERTAGFRIIDRTSPLRATGEGATFLAEARRLLAELDRPRDKPRAATMALWCVGSTDLEGGRHPGGPMKTGLVILWPCG